MYHKLHIFLLSSLTFVAALSPVRATSEATLSSPDNGLKVTVDVASQIPYLTVKRNDKQVAKVRLGLTLEDANFGSRLTFVSATEPAFVSDTYQSIHGKRSVNTCQANATELTFTNQDNESITVEVRAYEDGIVFRYKLPGGEDKTLSFKDELTTYIIPSKAHRWLQPFNTSYEADFPYQASAGKTGTWGFPSLFELDGTFMLLTEANIGRNYSATHLDNSASSSQYKVCYPFDYEGYNVGASKPSYTGRDWVSPWRVLIVGDLATVVESTLVEDVSDPCAIEETGFVLPGRAAWIYWAYNHSSKDYQICTKYTDLAVTMGWEYVLIDWEWEQMGNGGSVEDAVRYARSKRVKPMLWYHSNDSKIQNHDERVKEFAWLKRIGVAGVKIDFFESDKQHTMQYFEDILKDAADYQLLVNFHGCTVPRGWSRTYPHLMSQEAVYGAEQYNNGPTMTTEGARINCLLTYTRNVIGPMDYTPVAFTNSQHPHTTTFAHELALSVAFESGIQHWADRPEGFLALPYEAKLHMKNVPVAWDETRFVDGYPGKAFVVARRKAGTWYVACINGEKKARQQDIALDFLPTGTHLLTLVADGTDEETFRITHRLVTADDRITVPCLSQGGFVLTVGEATYKQFVELKRQANSLLKTAKKNVGAQSGQYKETMVSTLEAAIAATADITAESTADQLNTAYASLGDAFSALQIYGQNEVLFTTGDCEHAKSGGKDVTKTYLHESRAFARADQERTTSGEYYRFGKPKYWNVENYLINEGSDGTKQGIDNYPGYNCLQLGRWEESASQMTDADHENQRLYQRVTLPAGRYFLGAAYHYIDKSRVGTRAYLTVSHEPLSTADVRSKALAWGTLSSVSDDGAVYGVRFCLEEEQEVVLGWQMDGRSEHSEFRCSQVQLLLYPQTNGVGEQAECKMYHGKWPGAVYDLSGRRIGNSTSDILHSHQQGLCLVNGKKVFIK